MSYLQLFFATVGVGSLGMGLVSLGIITLVGTLILYMCDVAIGYWEVG